MQGRMIFLLEEPSMKTLLEGLLPRLFPGMVAGEHFLCIKQAYTYRPMSSHNSMSGVCVGTSCSIMKSIRYVMNSRAVVISQSLREKICFSSACILVTMNSIFMSRFTYSGRSPIHSAISRMRAYALRRCSGDIVLPSGSPICILSYCLIKARSIFGNAARAIM